MCRYAFKIYKWHMVCFTCRIALKDAPECPHCRQLMVTMGLDFKAPRRTNVREWKRVYLLYLSGFRYSSCGCMGPGNPAPTLREAKQILEQEWAKNPVDAMSRDRRSLRKPAPYEKKPSTMRSKSKD